jgi:hypothetical protein
MLSNTASKISSQIENGHISLVPPDTQVSARAKTEPVPILPCEGLCFIREVNKNNVRQVEYELREEISKFAKLYREHREVSFSFSINLVFESPELYHKIGRTIIDIEKHCKIEKNR